MSTARHSASDETYPNPLHQNHNMNNLQGFILIGTIIARSRRYTGADRREVIDYRILAGPDTYNVSDWDHQHYYELDEQVVLKVKCSIRTANGIPRIQYTVDNRQPTNF